MPEHDQTLGPYTVLRPIGAGGMGEVHLARDPRLEREVALKLLPPDLRDDPERRSRFLREARAAAKLSHPNITAIHEVGEADGRDYIAFEYVEGRTLDDRLAEGPLPLPELLELALPLADALAYAHERGVVHRDLKAANVMVTSRGHPKLLDFGLAKLLDEEDGTSPSQTTSLTQRGAVFGTPQAMSPEQALGRPVDERSDVFSFGSLLYQMARGAPAFGGDTMMEVVDAVIHAEPPDLAGLRPDLPPEFVALVARAMRKDPAERYPSFAGLLADLRHVRRQGETGPVPVGRRRTPVAAWLALAVLVTAGLVWTLRDGGGAAGADVAAPLAARSIAVMGFELLGAPSATNDSSLDRALTSLVTTALAEAGGIDVASSSKVLACLRRAGQDPGAGFDPGVASAAAADAGVDLMLVGQVLTRGAGLTLTAELVNVGSGNTLGSLRRQVASEDELFTLAEGLSTDVRTRLGLARPGAEPIDLEADLTDSPEAYFKYVAGEMALHEGRFSEAVRLLEQAVEIDPTFAFAYVRLGTALEWEGAPAAAVQVYETALVHATRLPDRWQRLVEIALAYNRGFEEVVIEKARALLDEGHDLPEAHNVYGEVLTHSARHRDLRRSLAAFLRAIELDPNFQIVLYHVVAHAIESGQPEVIDDLLARLQGQGVNPEGLAYLEIGRDLAHQDYAAAASRIEAAGRVEADFEEYVRCLGELGRLDEMQAAITSYNPAPGTSDLRNKLTSQGNLAFWRGHLDEAASLYQQSAATLAIPAEGRTWYAANAATALLRGACAARLLGRTEEAMTQLDAAIATDPYLLRLDHWKLRWLVEDGREDDAALLLERMRELAAECTSPAAASWLALAETELALARGDMVRARERLATLDDVPLGDRPGAETELTRAHLARAVGDAAGEVAALGEALRAARGCQSEGPTLSLPTLYHLADAEERAGLAEAAREHGRELLSSWGGDADVFPMLEDARARWGD